MQLPQDVIIWFSQEPIVWVFGLYLIFINFLAILVMWWDKRMAANDGWRISEATLHLISFCGGAFGVTIGMFGFRHKTRKISFQVITLVAFIVSVVLYWIEYRAIIWHLYLV